MARTSSLRKCIALRDFAACKSTLEPLHALCRRTVGERLGTYASSGHSLYAIITNCASRLYPRLHIALIDEITLGRGVCPDAGETISLQLQADGKGICLGRVLQLQGAHLVGNAQEFLDVMSDLVCNHVCLGELALSPKSTFQLVIKAQVDIDFFVCWTIKRSRGRLG